MYHMFQFRCLWKIMIKPRTGNFVFSLHICYIRANITYHDDVIKWKYFLRNWPFVRGIRRGPANSPHKSQWRGTLMFSLICTRISSWVNNREAGDLRRHSAHYGVIVLWRKALNWYTEAGTKRPRFGRNHLEVYFLSWRWVIFIQITLKFIPKGPIDNNLALDQIKAKYRTGDTPLFKLMTVWLISVYVSLDIVRFTLG